MLNFGKTDVISDVNFALGVDFLVLNKNLRKYDDVTVTFHDASVTSSRYLSFASSVAH